MTDDELISTGAAATLLGVTRQHVADLCDRGELPCVMVGAHRRLRRGDVKELIDRPMRRDAEKALWLHQLVAGRLVLDPDAVLDRARRNIAKLRGVHRGTMAERWLEEWQRLVDKGADVVLVTLTSRAPRAVELRQNSPFIGIVPHGDRLAALRSFREHWKGAHAK